MSWMNASAVAAADRRNAEDHGKESPDGYGIRARDDFSTPYSVEETEARLAARRAEDEARAQAIAAAAAAAAVELAELAEPPGELVTADGQTVAAALSVANESAEIAACMGGEEYTVVARLRETEVAFFRVYADRAELAFTRQR